MDLKLAGKTALITGASKGIGGAAAEMLAAEGCHLVLVARTAGDLARAKESIARKANVSVETVPTDLSDSANVTRLAREFPDIDILVNNAGAIPGGKLLDIDEATWRSAWDLKVFGYINMCRAFYALMKARHAGVIINVVGNAAIGPSWAAATLILRVIFLPKVRSPAPPMFGPPVVQKETAAPSGMDAHPEPGDAVVPIRLGAAGAAEASTCLYRSVLKSMRRNSRQRWCGES
jgi:NAD(P)-dependent dehydrogenase (short-subunit alcohol dehydrogenase family)